MKPICRQCGAPSSRFFTVGDINRNISDERFDYYRCDSCSLIFLADIPQDLGRYYPTDYYTLAGSTEQAASWAEYERYKLDIVQRFVDRGRLLEIGPASGGFALLAKNAGFEVEAIEMSESCCQFLNGVLGIRAIHSTDEREALKRANDPDVIALWHVIEHLPDPWAILEDAANKLRSGGVLVVAAPNPQALQFKVLGRSWVHVDAPRHVSLIPISVIAQKMARLEMTLELQTTADEGSLGWNKFGWEYSFANWFKGSFAKRVARKAGRILARVLAPVESKEGLGSAYTLVFRKRAAA